MHVKVGPDGGDGEGGSPKHAYPAGRWPPHHASAPCSHPRHAPGQDILREVPVASRPGRAYAALSLADSVG
jgi:hypothetical protein